MSVSDSELITSNLKEDTNNICPICYNSIESSVTLRCSHKLCLFCLIKSINHINIKCPLCRDLLIEAQPIIETYNNLIINKEELIIKVSDLNISNIEKDEIIKYQQNEIIQKNKIIDLYRDMNIDSHNQYINIADKLVSQLEREIELEKKYKKLQEKIKEYEKNE